MRPEHFSHPIEFLAALSLTTASVRPTSTTETRDLISAAGRPSAETVTAACDIPRFDRSAMDGYAVRSADTSGAANDTPARLRYAGLSTTGTLPTTVVSTGECVEIATGAPLPDGADAVVMVERTTRSSDRVDVIEPVREGQNVNRRGADVKHGQRVIEDGDLVTPAKAGVLAAVGRQTLRVYAPPTVAIFSTGGEVVSPGQPLSPGQIYDVNTTTLASIVAAHGGRAVTLPPVADDEDALAAALVAAAAYDIIVCSGGSSVGRRDLLTDALARTGRTVFHGIAIKPGKPTLFGFVNDTPLFGMPGNPTSCLSNAYLFLVPFLRATARLPAWRPTQVTVPLARRIVSNANRYQFFTVKLVDGQAEPAFKSSSDITSMASADGYIEIPAETATIEAGTRVVVTLFQ